MNTNPDWSHEVPSDDRLSKEALDRIEDEVQREGETENEKEKEKGS